MTSNDRKALGYILGEALNSCGSISQTMTVLDIVFEVGELIEATAHTEGLSGFMQRTEFTASYNAAISNTDVVNP
jgi:hypothetical protein